MKKFSNKNKKSLAFKSVTFNVQKTLNDSHSIVIQINSNYYFPGDIVNGYVYLNFSENIPCDSIDLIISGSEETSFTLKLQHDVKEQEGLNKLFYKKVYLLQSENGIPAKEYVFPFQFTLPNDIPASVAYQDAFCNASVKYEISLSLISKNKNLMEDIHAKKVFYVYEKKRVSEIAQTIVDKTNTCTDSTVGFWSGKEKLLNDDDKITIENNELDPKLEFYEYNIVFNSFFCFIKKSLTLTFMLQKSTVFIGEAFKMINKIRGYISLEYIQYAFYREIKCESSTQKYYINKTLIEEQEVNDFHNKNQMSVHVNFKFKGNSDIKLSRMPSCQGKIIQCKYYIFIALKAKSCFATGFTYKIPIHVSGEVNNIDGNNNSFGSKKINGDGEDSVKGNGSKKDIAILENLFIEEDFKNISYPLQEIILK